MTNLTGELSAAVRNVANFPVKGVTFKDITPIFANIKLFNKIIDAFADKFADLKIDKIAGVESRGFLFGMPLAVKMNIPFVLIRKKGKLPGDTIWASYNLEYGTAIIETHKDSFSEGEKVLLIDDLLATGGTINASAELVRQLKAKTVAAAFVAELAFLKGRENIKDKNIEIFSIIKY
ncbi:adenine phosphoribosyltransferase [Endomicrobium proavitum]|uniref:Adenine phosphoribosyltransferase n=1 Tax=Endomicrobium proavitum TaxID=1408281 RepID=A0A0G3WIS8_9BACT|nr:adenine phosphoribosyltransferase [Endomicrobium proavitum]AKL97795.1 Adenine phosphoribosyltransferase [Endomicrobium proavitum]